MHLLDSDNEEIIISVNPKPARNTATLAGNSYYFFAEWDGADLKFTERMIDSRDGNIYKVVTIGNQVWMAENLKYLPSVVDMSIGSKTDPYYYVYGYSSGTEVNEAKEKAYYNNIGVLYNYSAAILDVCPTGWHLPNDLEWEQLKTFLGDALLVGGKLKEAGNKHWDDPNVGATNESGFTALPSGMRDNSGEIVATDNFALWWSKAEPHVTNPWSYYVARSSAYFNRIGYVKEYGFSIRCVKD
ncbi:MAG: FISUMP domain-containing protein [Dysgonamonadaceae bacterium]|nr:FISUMP domain-containing protein [Dysgonamonadaceae bacterium]